MMSSDDPGGSRPGQLRPSSASEESSTIPSTVPRRQTPPPRGHGRSSPPSTPYPLSVNQTNVPKKSVRFSEQSQMKFYQPEVRPPTQHKQKSKRGRGGGQARGQARGRIFSKPKSAPDISSNQLSSRSKQSFFSSEKQELTREESSSSPWTVGAFSQGPSLSSSGLGQDQQARTGPTFSKKLEEFNCQAGSSPAPTSVSALLTPKPVSLESMEKVRRLMKKRKLPLEQRHSTVDMNKVGSEKATDRFFNSSVSPIPGAQTGGNLRSSYSTIPKRARTKLTEETDPNTSKQGIASASSVSLFNLDKAAPSAPSAPDVSFKTSTKVTESSAAGVESGTDKDSGTVFKVPTFPAPSRHKSYYNSEETTNPPSKPAASESSSEKTVSTIPKKPRQPRATAGKGEKVPQPQPQSTYRSIDSLFELVLPNRKKPEEQQDVTTQRTDRTARTDCNSLLEKILAKKKKPAEDDEPEEQQDVRTQRTDFLERILARKKKPAEEEDLPTLPSTVRGKQSQRPSNLLSEDVVRVRVRRPKDQKKVKEGEQVQPSSGTVSTSPGAPAGPRASTGVASTVFTTKRGSNSQTSAETATTKPEAARKGKKAEAVSDHVSAGAAQSVGISEVPSSGISSILPGKETKQPPDVVVGSESNAPERAKAVTEDGELLYTSARLSRHTNGKLMTFSLRLKNLRDPSTIATPATSRKTTQRHEIVTPRPQARTKTPDTRHTSVTTVNMTLDPPDPKSFAAVFEGTGSAAGEVGVASFSLSSPNLIVCQFSDSQTYPMTVSKLLSINPSQILVPDITGAGGKLYEDLEAKIKGSKVVKVQRKFFNEKKGLSVLRKLVVPEFSMVEMQFINKYYCLAAAAALLKVCHRDW